nr:MAG TPA: hypothetical protein [Caudoviricetes sp.]
MRNYSFMLIPSSERNGDAGRCAGSLRCASDGLACALCPPSLRRNGCV